MAYAQKNSSELPPVEGTVIGRSDPAQQSHPAHQRQNDVVIDGTPLYDDWEDPQKSRFVAQGYKDLWAAVVFVVVMLGTAALAIKNLSQPTVDATSTSDDLDTSSAKRVALYAPFAVIAATLAASLSVWAMKNHPRGYIITANILAIALNVCIVVMALAGGVYVLAALMAVCVVLQIVWFISAQNRIPFSALLLKTSGTLVVRHWGMLVVSFGGLAAGIIFMLLWAAAVLPTLTALDANGKPKSDSTQSDDAVATNGVVLFLFNLLLYWGAQVVFNVVHVTSSGTVATWYFVGEERMPQHPTGPNLRRAMTTSFGSICLGSFIVAFLKLLYRMAREAIRSIDHEVIRCLLAVVVGILEWLTELFNIYAFTHVAVYGSSFMTAAKQTWALVKDCGWAALFNDALVWPVMTLTNLFAALFLGTFFGLMSHDAIVGVMAALVSWVVFIVLLRPVYSAIATQFVCVAECPEAMQTANPLYHAALLNAMPPGETLQSDAAHQV